VLPPPLKTDMNYRIESVENERVILHGSIG
jgi:hypothetical protein